MGNRRVIYRNDDYMFTVSDDEGRLVLEVLCGGSGMYVREHWLTVDEVSSFRQDPEALSALARYLCS